MVKKVFGLDTQPGIQRDGTVTDRNYYTDGRWVRFQRARPRKIYGYREITNNLAGPSRGIYLDPKDQFNNVYSGWSGGVQSVEINSQGIGSGVIDLTLSDFTPDVDNLWQFDSLFDAGGSAEEIILAHPGHNLSYINSQVNTPVLGGSTNGTSLSQIGIFTAAGSTNTTTTITLAAPNYLVGAGQLITDAAGDIPAGTYVVSVTGGVTVVLSQSATNTTVSNTFTFNNNIEVSGGVVVLHPYILSLIHI